jgi:UDP-N-acetylmuramoyl-tripeptide--D-alanyl-D-alanine ligase
MADFLRKASYLAHAPTRRSVLMKGVIYLTWPLLRHVAKVYRMTAARRTRIVTVVGSLGKTTATRAIATALGLRVDPAIEHNAFSYVAMALFQARPWNRHAVIEVGIGRRGHMKTYATTIRPDIAVVTSIASEHNRSFGDLSVTRAEKAEMVRVLTTSGLAVLNGDDQNVIWMREMTRARVVTFGFSGTNDVRATDIALDWPHGTRFRIHVDGETREVRTRLIGRRFVCAVLAAVAVGLSEGFSLDVILARLESLSPSSERLEPVRLATGAYLLRDECKSTIETIDAALDVMAEIPARRKIVILGDVSEPPGSQGPVYRRLAHRIAEIATHVIFIGANCHYYTAGAARAGMRPDAVTKANTSLKKALLAIPADLGEGDVLLIKGRDNQRLGRIALALMGRKVRCGILPCSVISSITCERCEMLDAID